MTDDLTAYIHEMMPLCATLGVRARSLDRAKVIFELDHSPGLCTSGGLLHGGAVMALADAAGGAAAFVNLPAGATATSTIESKTNFLGAVTAGTLVATSTPLHVGRSTIVVETELRVGDRLVGKTTQTQTVLTR